MYYHRGGGGLARGVGPPACTCVPRNGLCHSCTCVRVAGVVLLLGSDRRFRFVVVVARRSRAGSGGRCFSRHVSGDGVHTDAFSWAISTFWWWFGGRARAAGTENGVPYNRPRARS